ncbi:hypothetical protein MMYC01_202072 [Madurella mycetomatis]|uniref:Uncharacterized protein n=1 Tax=Madurella mycetomatis TaxID=100816 RepID=A0A175WAT3_9PEZI|nr:hypothetical protein MMYC01_202072 [Madurella mycetomatis]
MLLTSAQVSVAVSSGVVFFFTAALFLSGYIIQQRTLRDLRAAIKPTPRPSPKVFLPDRFQQSTTELPDRSVIVVDDGEKGADQNGNPVVEVNLTPPDDNTQKTLSNGQQASDETVEDKKGTKRDKSSTEADDLDKPQKPISRAERRKRIKEEIMRLSQAQEHGYYQRRRW